MFWNTCFVELMSNLLCFRQLPSEPLWPSTTLGPPKEYGATLPAATKPIEVPVPEKHDSEEAAPQPSANTTLTTLPQEIRDVIYDFINEDQMIVWIVPFLSLSEERPFGNFLAILKNPFKRETSLLHVNRQLRFELLKRLCTRVTLTKSALVSDLRLLSARGMPSPNSIRMTLVPDGDPRDCTCQVAERYRHDKLFLSMGVAEFVVRTPRLVSLQIGINCVEHEMPCDTLEALLRALIAAHPNLNVLAHTGKGTTFFYHLSKE